MRAEIISIGDELTSGNRLDTNSQWLSQQLASLGVQTAFHSTVGDNLLDNIDTFRHAASRADIVIATGGLGPTADDLTREAMSAAFERPLEMRQEALDHIENLFATRKRPMPERNRAQAMFPAGSVIIPNPHGTAPGIDISVTTQDRASRIFALPGVPAEMQQMYNETIVPTLVRELGVGKTRWFYRTLKVFGIGESDVEKLLPEMIARDRDPVVGITVSKATITLRIAACCETENEFNSKIASTEKEIHEKLGLLVFGTGDSDLDNAVAELLDNQRLKLGVIEFGAGVWIAPALSKHQSTDPEFGLVAAKWYPHIPAPFGLSANDAPAPTIPASQLKTPVAHEDTESSASVHESRLRELAQAMMEREGLDLCLAVASYPPYEAIQSATTLPMSDFLMVLARKGMETKSTHITLGAHPEVLYHRLAKTGMNFLRTELLQRA